MTIMMGGLLDICGGAGNNDAAPHGRTDPERKSLQTTELFPPLTLIWVNTQLASAINYSQELLIFICWEKKEFMLFNTDMVTIVLVANSTCDTEGKQARKNRRERERWPARAKMGDEWITRERRRAGRHAPGILFFSLI